MATLREFHELVYIKVSSFKSGDEEIHRRLNQNIIDPLHSYIRIIKTSDIWTISYYSSYRNNEFLFNGRSWIYAKEVGLVEVMQ